MKIRNYYIYDEDQERLKRLEGDYLFMGSRVKLEQGRLIVLALPPRRRRVKKTRFQRRS